MMYEYPAIISYSKDDKVYYVDFSDISGCFTDGESLREALDNAEDAENTMLSFMEGQGQKIPKSSDLNSIKLGSGEIVVLIKTDTVSYSKIAI